MPVHDDHLAEVAKLLAVGEDEQAARLLFSFRVCDPAMGSGHFLVDALDVLTDRVAKFLSERPIPAVRATLNQLREVVQAQARDLPAGALADIRDVELLRRVVLKRSIYGVDLNPMAVELAKLGLWLHAFVPGLPLSYLDHNLKCGNSLVGVVGDEVLEALRPAEATLEGDWIAHSLEQATAQAREAVERVEVRLADVEAAEAAEAQRRMALADVDLLYHRWTADAFGLAGARERIHERDTLQAASDEREAARLAEEIRFFHWPLEYPEVFAADRPGFDIVLGNPPWDKVRFESQQFWVARFPGLNALPAADRDVRMDELRATFPSDAQREQVAAQRAAALQGYFAHVFRLQDQHLDLAKLFLERAAAFARRTGAIGFVLPRQFLVLVGWARLRQELFFAGETSVAQLSNRGGWIFPEVEHRYLVALVAHRRGSRVGRIRCRGGIAGPDRLAAGTMTTQWNAAELRDRLSETLALPLLPNERDAEVFAKLERAQRLGDAANVFGGVVSDTPFDWTEAARRSYVQSTPAPANAFLILQTRHVGAYLLQRQHPFRKWVAEEKALELLDAKWRASRSLGALDPQPASASDAPDVYALVYRYAARSDDSRTVIAALAPYGFLPAKGYAHSAVPLRNTERHRLALLACLNTLTADWWARRYVDRHVTSGVMRGLPAPPWDDERLTQVAAAAGEITELLASGEAADVGSAVAALRAQIEYLYASALGLEAADVAWIVDSFNEEGAPPDVRERVLHLFAQAAA